MSLTQSRLVIRFNTIPLDSKPSARGRLFTISIHPIFGHRHRVLLIPQEAHRPSLGVGARGRHNYDEGGFARVRLAFLGSPGDRESLAWETAGHIRLGTEARGITCLRPR